MTSKKAKGKFESSNLDTSISPRLLEKNSKWFQCILLEKKNNAKIAGKKKQPGKNSPLPDSRLCVGVIPAGYQPKRLDS